MWRGLVVFAILIPGIPLALTSRLRGLYLYLWFAFFRPQEWLWFDVRALRLSMLIGLILVVPALATGVFPHLTHPLTFGTMLFMVLSLVAQTNAIDQDIGWTYIDIHGSYTVVCLLAVNIVKTPRDLMRVLAVAAGCMAFFATKAGFMSLLSGGTQYRDGLAGAFLDNNAYAVGTVMTLPLLVALAQNAEVTFTGLVPRAATRWIRFFILYISIPLCMYTIVSTFSRGGFLALVAAGLTYGLFHQRRLRFIGFVGILAALLYVVPLPAGYVDRIATIKQLQEDVERPEDDVTYGRFYFWGVAIEMVKDYPLGIGMRNFSARYREYDSLRAFGRARDVHSSHFQVLVELGYLGAVVWIFLFGYSFWIALKIRKRARTPGLSVEDARLMVTLPIAFIVSLAGFAIGGATVSMALNEMTWLTFAMMASLDIISARLCAAAVATSPGVVAATPPKQAGARAVSASPRGPVQEWTSR